MTTGAFLQPLIRRPVLHNSQADVGLMRVGSLARGNGKLPRLEFGARLQEPLKGQPST